MVSFSMSQALYLLFTDYKSHGLMGDSWLLPDKHIFVELE